MTLMSNSCSDWPDVCVTSDPSRNYHVFYYLLVGAAKEEQKELRLLQPRDYLYLNQVIPGALTHMDTPVFLNIV